MSVPLSPADIHRALGALPGWSWENDALTTTRQFGSFRAAMDFMLRASYVADAMDHHPEWTNVYQTVTIRLCTHDAGGRVTGRDIELAAKLQQLLQAE